MNYAFMVAPFIYFFPGIEVATSKSNKSVDMGMTFLTVAFLGLGTVGVYLGLGDLIVSTLSPMLTGVSPTVAILGIIMLCYIANSIMTPLGIMAALAVPLAASPLTLASTRSLRHTRWSSPRTIFCSPMRAARRCCSLHMAFGQ